MELSPLTLGQEGKGRIVFLWLCGLLNPAKHLAAGKSNVFNIPCWCSGSCRGLVYFCLEKFSVTMETATLKVTMEEDRHFVQVLLGMFLESHCKIRVEKHL